MAIVQEPSAVGVYEDLDSAERTIDDLRRAGFAADEVGIIGQVGQDSMVPTPPQMHAPEDNAIAGFVRGAVVGAIAGAIVMLAIPGLGVVSGLGTGFEIVGGAALSAVICGVLIALQSFVFMRSKSRLYAAALERGLFIVTVKNPARREEAASLLRQRVTAGQAPSMPAR